MLQITTGKFFARDAGRVNYLRGTLFTNLRLDGWPQQVLEHPLFGRIVQTSELNSIPKTLIYEFTERIEAPLSGPGLIVSNGADPYLQDMATLISFAFNCTCSPNIDLVRRLTSEQRGIATNRAPNTLVRRVFDKELFSRPSESKEFVHFVAHLLGLQRTTYLGVMRAIRTYVTGLHRVADDLELAYTLMVAAGQSLAQDFDGHTSDWESVSEHKRRAIDQALNEAPGDLAAQVREAVLSFEHTSLARRFQAFVAANVAPEYFCAQFEKNSHPVGRSDLPEVLATAYQARSQYVHQLHQLSDMVTLSLGHVETVIEGRRRMLTLQGLSRLMRHIIMTFVQRQPTVEKEEYNYSLELAGVAQVRLAPSFWVAHADGDISAEGRNKLEGFLEELANVEVGLPGASVTDISEVLGKFAKQAPNIKLDNQRPYLALLVMFNAIAGEKAITRSKTLEGLIQKILGVPCSEALVALAYFGETAEFSLEDHCRAFLDYKRRRASKSGIRFPRLFEAAIALELAERYRSAGLFEDARKVVSEAADDYPDHTELRKLAVAITADKRLSWREVLLPEAETKGSVQSSDGTGL